MGWLFTLGAEGHTAALGSAVADKGAAGDVVDAIAKVAIEIQCAAPVHRLVIAEQTVSDIPRILTSQHKVRRKTRGKCLEVDCAAVTVRRLVPIKDAVVDRNRRIGVNGTTAAAWCHVLAELATSGLVKNRISFKASKGPVKCDLAPGRTATVKEDGAVAVVVHSHASQSKRKVECRNERKGSLAPTRTHNLSAERSGRRGKG